MDPEPDPQNLYHWIMVADPVLFFSGFQDANKKFVFFKSLSKITLP
jgi:hypothetical protein